MNLDSIASSIAHNALAIKAKYPTETDLLTFMGTSTSTPPSVDTKLIGARAEFRLSSGVAPSPQQQGQGLLDRWANEIHKAVCVDFNYWSKKADVDANLNKYLPDIVKALIHNKVGANGPSWLATVLGIFGFTAGWEATEASIVAWLIEKGLNAYCGCK